MVCSPSPGDRGATQGALLRALQGWPLLAGFFQLQHLPLRAAAAAALTRVRGDNSSQQPDLYVICSFADVLRLLKASVNAFKGI